MDRFRPEIKEILDKIEALTPWDKEELLAYLSPCVDEEEYYEREDWINPNDMSNTSKARDFVREWIDYNL